MKLLPIEAGCKALYLIGDRKIGVVCLEKVEEYTWTTRSGDPETVVCKDDLWVLDRPVYQGEYPDGEKVYLPISGSNTLMRIDGSEDQFKQESEDLERIMEKVLNNEH